MNTPPSQDTRESPTVTVLIATYNRGTLIRETLDSLRAQTRLPDEIVVVDDGSTDDTAAVLAEYSNHIVYRHQPNKGRPAALNLALESIESTYVWIFDDDDIALPNAIAAHLEFLARNPHCDFSYSPGYRFSGTFSSQALTSRNLQRLKPVAPENFLLYVLESMPIKVQGMMVPMRCYRAVGAFDERLHRSQDHDVLIRFARRFRAGLLDEPTFALRVHDGPRGPGFARHASKDRAPVWRQYQNIIYSRLRADLPLEEYLPGQTFERPGKPTALEQRRALLERALIMAQYGLYSEAISDLEDGLKILSFSAQAPTQDEKRLLSHMVWIDDVENIPPGRFYLAVGTIAARYASFSQSYIRGFYWTYRRSSTRASVLAQSTARLGLFLFGAIKGRLSALARPD